MRESYVPLFESLMTSTLWAHPAEVLKCWVALLLRADPEGYWCGTVPGLALEAHVPIDAARRAMEVFEAPDPDSRDADHDGRRVQRVPRGWFLFNIRKHRERAKVEAEKARKRIWAAAHRSKGDHEPPPPAPVVDLVPIADFASSNEEAKLDTTPERDPIDRAPPGVDAVSMQRSEPVDAPKPEEIDAIERELLGVPPPPPGDLNKRAEAEEGPRFHDLIGFEPSTALITYAERFGLPPMALGERLRKVRNARVQIGGKNGVGDREQWCRDQLPRWKKWWLDDGGRAEPLPVQRRAAPVQRPSSPAPVGESIPMPEALLKFVATGQLPPLQPTRASPAAEVAA